MNMSVDLALADYAALATEGKHSTSPLVWRWEKVKNIARWFVFNIHHTYRLLLGPGNCVAMITSEIDSEEG